MRTLTKPTELTLHAETAADLMMENPVSIRENASLHEAIHLFTTRGFSAAPVIDAAGRPIGVVSRSDVIIHDRAKFEWGNDDARHFKFEPAEEAAPGAGVPDDDARETTVCDVMTPAVFSVSPGTSAAKVIEEMLALKIHRVFVVDDDGVLVGVVSTLDVLRRLLP